ncbi:MAG: hypothetical protein WCX46_04210 [Candidatus Paceibacterota bacterium]
MKWAKEDEEYLKNNLLQSNDEVGKKLNRTGDSIARKRKRLGLKSIITLKENTQEGAQETLNKLISKEENKEKISSLKILTKEYVKIKKERDSFLQVGGVETYAIKSNQGGGKSSATAVALASDWHYEENVISSQVNGLNKYDTNIAKERIEKFFTVIAKLINVHKKEYNIENLMLALLGDFISGSIHDDLKESNHIQPTQAIWEVQNLIASGIKFLLKETDVNLVIPCSAGNHSRITEKQRVSTEFGNSLEILMYRQLEKYFSNEPRVKFIISDSYLTYVKVYNYTCRLHHGHAIKYGGGIGGIFVPAFKAISQWNKSKQADWDFFGHFHQLKDGGNFISNGSLIGFNSYAIKIKADYEKPKQAFLIIDEERGLEVTRKITL